MAQNLRELRLLVDLGGDLRRIAKIAVSNTDASLYLFPYAPNGRYYFGGRRMNEVEFKDQVRFKDDLSSDDVPKLSIHETGQVHVQARGIRAGPNTISPLSEWKGQHIASVSVDSFSALSEFSGAVSSTGPNVDHVIPVDENIQSGRLVFYLSGDRPAFEEPNCRLVITLKRPTLANPIYVGIQMKAQAPLSEPHLGGVTVLSGWDAYPKPGEGMDYLYIRGI